ncbi:hypothetical protein [Lentzea albidocapillata]|uniref:Uncharacterized protein n=1 Tax=Lentzea albidocapillata TaxID=40571 RepID=A0A1W2DG58_9PSEU|nr:hypothetical protein [Lentzea albidocapillata]SMC96510.1 hypothetical protein SAMN05660733_03005 [Lentzea albidocapillata]
MTDPGTPPPGTVGGPDTRTWRWEQALNIFSDDGTFPITPARETVTAPVWLKWEAKKEVNDQGTRGLLSAAYQTNYGYWYAEASVTPEVESALTPFVVNANKILNGALGDTLTTVKRTTFDTAATTLRDAAAVLTAQVEPLQTWRQKVGHEGNDFQGRGADAFGNVLNGLGHRCRNLVEQMSRERTSWDALVEVRDFVARYALQLQQGWLQWQSGERRSYDTGMGFQVHAAGSDLIWPAGVLAAIWQSPELVADIKKGAPTTTTEYMDNQPRYPVSTILGGKLDQAGPWLKLETAAKKVWADHMVNHLDGYSAGSVGMLTAAYDVAGRYLPQIQAPTPFTLPGSGGGPGPGSGGAGGGGGDGSGSGGPNGPNGSGGPNGPDGNNSSLGGPPPPPTVITNPNGPPGPGIGGSNASLKVPSGSYVGPNGVVLGPNGKPVLGANGKPIIVPKGSRVNSNGEIVGPKGGAILDQKDRLRAPYGPPTVESNGQSALERHLSSLRRTPAPVPPPSTSLPMTVSRFDPLANLFSGPGSFGGSHVSVSSNLPPSFAAPPGTTPPPSVTGGPPSTGGPKGTVGGGGVPFYPPMAGGMGGAQGENKGERDRSTWLAEDEKTWGTDPEVAPGVLGRRRRKATRRSAVVATSDDTQRDHTLGLGGQAFGNSATTG